MRRLSATDSRFLDLEAISRPMHTLKIAVIEPPQGGDFEDLRASIAKRILNVPTMQWRLSVPPGGLGRPSWVEDPEFDLDRHLIRKPAPAPGRRRELYKLVARAAEAPLLDRRRPLWELWVVEGLDGCRMAVIARVHHAFADGVSFARILASWFSPTPLAREPSPGVEKGLAPRLAAVLSTGPVEEARALAAFTRARRASVRAPATRIPETPFNGRTLSPSRRFACQALPLSEIHSVRKALGATVNDMLVALVAAALRGHLRDLGALPVDPLVATMPASLLPAEQHATVGNRGLATTTVRLPTDVEDAVARVRTAHANAQAAKAELAATQGARLENAVDLLPRRAVRAVGRFLDSRHGARLGNLSLSNVRGPAEPLTTDGFLVEDFFSVGPCMPSVGINITAWSYADRFNVALLADAARLDDPRRLLARMPAALEELTSEMARDPGGQARR